MELVGRSRRRGRRWFDSFVRVWQYICTCLRLSVYVHCCSSDCAPMESRNYLSGTRSLQSPASICNEAEILNSGSYTQDQVQQSHKPVPKVERLTSYTPRRATFLALFIKSLLTVLSEICSIICIAQVLTRSPFCHSKGSSTAYTAFQSIFLVESYSSLELASHLAHLEREVQS